MLTTETARLRRLTLLIARVRRARARYLLLVSKLEQARDRACRV